MSFTKREQAHNLFESARALSTAKAFGADADFHNRVIAERLAFIDKAIAAIDQAEDSERILLREPDSLKLAQMRAILEERRNRFLPEYREDHN
jgi:hypothetical protein